MEIFSMVSIEIKQYTNNIKGLISEVYVNTSILEPAYLLLDILLVDIILSISVAFIYCRLITI